MKDQKEKEGADLYEQLLAYGASDFYPFHMPGHKRKLHLMGDPYAVDITEIDGFDNLHHAETVLLEAQRRAARLYGAEETFYLINGSTCGILSAVSACVRRGETILMARGCHKAAYHALLLNDLRAEYLYPCADLETGILGAIRPEQVRSALEQNPQIRTVLITSPTYDGVVSDVRAIAEIVHEKGGILIVDEAHGAHFGMHPYFPEGALSCGADLVINSVHKTLPSLTQTALLHVQGPRVDRERLRRYLGIYQSSSPSYVLMAGIDRCIRLLEEQGPELFETFARRLEQIRDTLSGLKQLHLVDGKEKTLNTFAYDRSKLVITTERTKLTGAELSELLRRKYHLEMEMDAPQYVTAITTLADTQEGLLRLQTALLEIDEALEREAVSGQDAGEKQKSKREAGKAPELSVLMAAAGEQVLTIAQAEEAKKQTVRLEESGGFISGEFVYLYPPGIPFLVPGERILEKLPEQLAACRALGLSLQGMADHTGEKLRVIGSL